MATAAVLLIAGISWALVTAADQSGGDIVGTIEGEAISVQGPLSVDTLNGRSRTVLRSGSDVRVKFAEARIELAEGGQLIICGPAHVSLLKSGGSLTVALDSGTLRAHVEREPALMIYTAQIQATLLPVGSGMQDALVGLDSTGAMCIRTTAGALRVENQLTGQSVVVPQGSDVTVPNGPLENLRNTPGQCSCEPRIAREILAQPAPGSLEISRPAMPEKSASPAAERPAAEDEPFYQVLMPPLSYDATRAVQNNHFDPRFILLVRRARVRPTLIFHGRVEGDPIVAENSGPSRKEQPVSASQPSAQTASPPAAQKDSSLYGRLRAFLRRLFS